MKLFFKLFLFVLLGVAFANVGYASPDESAEKASFEELKSTDFEAAKDSFVFAKALSFFKWQESETDTAEASKDSTIIFVGVEAVYNDFAKTADYSQLYRPPAFIRMSYLGYWVRADKHKYNERQLFDPLTKHSKKWVRC